MRSYVRSYKTEQTELLQTHSNHPVQIITIHSQRPMLIKIINQGFPIPATQASRVEPGNLYVRQTPNGSEFVRKRQQSKHEMPSHRPIRQRETRIYRRKSSLEEELAEAERRKQEARLRRERQRLEAELATRPRTINREPREPDSPAISPTTRLTRRISVQRPILGLDIPYSGHRQQVNYQRPPEYHEPDFESPHYIIASPETVYFSPVEFAEPRPQAVVRRASYQRLRPHYLYEEAIPSASQRHSRHRGRQNSDQTLHRRRSGPVRIHNVLNIEDRTPEDYYRYDWYS